MRDAYFPRMDLHFSTRENPMAMVRSLDKFYSVLRQELLYLWYQVESQKPNNKQLALLGGAMLRTLGQLPIESKMDYKLARSSLEKMPEFLFF